MTSPEADLTGWNMAPFSAAGFTYDVYGKGQGPGVVLMPEMPGIHPGVLGLGNHLVANGFTVRFDGSYSDGGINGRRLDPAHRDLRQFVRSWKRGKRYRVLTHPQYYFSPHHRSGRLAGTPWYDEILETYASDLNGNAWKDVWNKVLPPRENLT